MKEPKKSVFQRAAEWGLPFGLYLSCAAVTSIYADWFEPLAFVSLILTLATPVVVYGFQRRMFVEEEGFTPYSGLWMLGILLFILGTLVSSLVVYLVLQYLRPGFIYDQVRTAIETYRSMPQLRDSEFLSVMQQMVDKRLLPSPIQMVFNAFWFISSGGSIVSAITAVLAQRRLANQR